MCLQTVVKIAPALKKIRDEKLPIFDGLIPSDRQLDAFTEMLEPLLAIKHMSEALESEHKPTIHMVLPYLVQLSTMTRSSLFKASGRTTKAFIEAFEAAINLKIKDQGRRMPAVCLANMLHPSFKGRLLNVLGQDYYDETVGNIKSLFPEVNPDSQATPDQVIVN